MKIHHAPPKASSLIESMRDIGYSFETALADIIDNSITAGASCIDIICEAHSNEPVIAIVDDGSGMTRDRLFDAMRPGSQSPLESRINGDLGRFGLGLKTASFSQCRRLTVATKQEGYVHAARWDLEYVSTQDDWLLQVLDDAEIQTLPFSDHLDKSGTLVVWEVLDRLSDETKRTSLKDHLYEQLDHARVHLELVFHRFLSGDRNVRKLTIRINGTEIEAFDPFNAKHKATIAHPEEIIQVAGFQVRVQSYVLPHHNKVSKSDWEKYAGEGGYLRNQGFYVYRAGRLIVHGTWFRLAKSSELTKLARVRVDIPTDLDHLWKIDVKKASASPPLVVRQRLTTIIDQITGASNRVYTHRGRQISDPNVISLWVRLVDKNEISYAINREHPIVYGMMEELDETEATHLESVLGLLEKLLPLDALFSDVAGRPESIELPELTHESLNELVLLSVRYLKDAELSHEEIIGRLAKAEPYKANWKIAEDMVRYVLEKNH